MSQFPPPRSDLIDPDVLEILRRITGDFGGLEFGPELRKRGDALRNAGCGDTAECQQIAKMLGADGEGGIDIEARIAAAADDNTKALWVAIGVIGRRLGGD